MSMSELFELLVAALREYLPHRWDTSWDLHHRQLLTRTFEDDTLLINTDFSATMNLDPQYRINSAISGHAIQAVFIVSHSPRLVPMPNGVLRRVMENDVWHFWGEETKGKLTNDNYFHTKCLDHTIQHYKNNVCLPFTRVVVNSDGCPTQYKLRKNCYALWQLAVKYAVWMEHTFAPTATFKTAVDGAGNDTKQLIRKQERWETDGCRAVTARDVFEILKLRMAQTTSRDEHTCALGSFTARHHRFLVDAHSKQPGDIEASDIIVTDYALERWDCDTLKGIQSVYAIRADPTHNTPCVSFRAHRCWCAQCRSGHSDSCPHSATVGLWQKKVISGVTSGLASLSTAPDPAAADMQEAYNDGFDNAVDAMLLLAVGGGADV